MKSLVFAIVCLMLTMLAAVVPAKASAEAPCAMRVQRVTSDPPTGDLRPTEARSAIDIAFSTGNIDDDMLDLDVVADGRLHAFHGIRPRFLPDSNASVEHGFSSLPMKLTFEKAAVVDELWISGVFDIAGRRTACAPRHYTVAGADDPAYAATVRKTKAPCTQPDSGVVKVFSQAPVVRDLYSLPRPLPSMDGDPRESGLAVAGDAYIADDGTVMGIYPTRQTGMRDFDQPALIAVSRARYAPAVRHCLPVLGVYQFRIDYGRVHDYAPQPW